MGSVGIHGPKENMWPVGDMWPRRICGPSAKSHSNPMSMTNILL